jgi:serine/threonine protein kinase
VHGSNKLGKGSYGSVYLATHRLTGDERAVKVMNVDRVTSYYLRKLHTEISILKCVDHPNIIKLQDVFFGKRSVYLVTDLCRGEKSREPLYSCSTQLEVLPLSLRLGHSNPHPILFLFHSALLRSILHLGGELFELLNSGKNQGFVFREDRASRLMRDMLSAVHYLHSKVVHLSWHLPTLYCTVLCCTVRPCTVLHGSVRSLRVVTLLDRCSRIFISLHRTACSIALHSKIDKVSESELDSNFFPCYTAPRALLCSLP